MPETLRIVQVAPFYEPVKGGVEEVVRKISEYMALRGHEIHVVTYNRLRAGGAGSLPKEEVINGVHVVRLRPRLTWSHGSYSPELPDVLRSLKPDVVHVHVWRHPHAFQVAMLKKEAGFKAVLHGHSPFYPLRSVGPVTWAYYAAADALLGRLARSYDAYIAITDYERRVVRARLGLNNNVVVVPNGVEEDSCEVRQEDKDPNLVLYLGRVSRDKNLMLLAKAMALVRDAVKEARLIMAGPDEGVTERVIYYLRSRGINAKYLGAVSEPVKHRLYAAAKIFALPSLFEGLSLALLEAGMHWTPSVITGQGGQLYAAPPDIAGLWARPRPRDYAEAIVKLLTDDGLWRKLSSGAREHAVRLVWGRILPIFERMYHEI